MCCHRSVAKPLPGAQEAAPTQLHLCCTVQYLLALHHAELLRALD